MGDTRLQCPTVMMAPAAQRKERTAANGRISIHLGTERLGTAQMDVMGSVKSIRSGRVGDRSAPASLARLPDRQPMCITYHVSRTTYHVDTSMTRRDTSATVRWRLTRGRLVAVVPMSEVLGILHHWDASHPYDNSIRTRIQSTWGHDPVVDVMKRAGGVFLTTDHSNRTWKDTQK